jgi:hypothetical protein
MLAALAALSLAGCSLVTIDFPEDPLSNREINARVATHRFVDRFSRAVQDAADEIAGRAEDEAIQVNALRWKIGATGAIATAAFQVSPRDALVDTWVYCAQMAAFFRGGSGSGLFGGLQEVALETSDGLEAGAAELTAAFATSEQLERFQQFVGEYAARTPLVEIAAPRDSAVPALYEFLGIDESEAVQTVGTLGQVVSDLGSRISMAGDQLPEQTAWRTELFLRRSGVDRNSLQQELDRFGARMERVASVAEQTPAILDSSLTRLQQELSVLMQAVDDQRAAALEGLGRERAALVEAFSRERATLVEAFSKERVATMEELERYSDQVLADAWSQIRLIINSVLIGAVALVIVLFGVPFGVGVLVGRLSKRGA